MKPLSLARTENFRHGATMALVPGVTITTWATVEVVNGVPIVTAIGEIVSEPSTFAALMKAARPVFVAVHDLGSINPARLFVAGLATMAGHAIGAFVAEPETVRTLARVDYGTIVRSVTGAGVKPRGDAECIAAGCAMYVSHLRHDCEAWTPIERAS